MTIEVVIRREGSGLLRACVVQGRQSGKNLLRGRSLTNVDSAKEAVKRRLIAEFKDWVSLEITWTIKA